MAMSSTAPSTSSTALKESRITKRKLEDAIHSLDDALGSSESLVHPPPAKRLHSTQSVYSTLAKYGIKAADSSSTSAGDGISTLSKATPHLSAILSRAANRAKNAFTFKSLRANPANGELSDQSVEYRPSSLSSFLSRLATFKLLTYANKPVPIDAVAAARCGWINEGKDRLLCPICAVSWVLAGREGMSRDSANALIEKQKLSLVEMHKNGCPWRTKQCDPAIYRIPLNTPAVMARDVKLNAMILQPLLERVSIKHPLTPAQVRNIRSALRKVRPPSQQTDSWPTLGESPTHESPPPVELSEEAALTSLFGWTLAPATTPAQHQPVSASRAASVAPSSPPTPSRSRSITPMSGDVTLNSPHSFGIDSDSLDTPHGGNRRAQDKPLLYCALCQRRVGLWTFAPGPQSGPQRQFDLLKEHRVHCPYVVRSTVLLSLPSPPAGEEGITNGSNPSTIGQEGAMEGWRAVTVVVGRYESNRRHRTVSIQAVDDENGTAWADDVDDVGAMLVSVKKRGGKELQNYVKKLLG